MYYCFLYFVALFWESFHCKWDFLPLKVLLKAWGKKNRSIYIHQTLDDRCLSPRAEGKDVLMMHINQIPHLKPVPEVKASTSAYSSLCTCVRDQSHHHHYCRQPTPPLTKPPHASPGHYHHHHHPLNSFPIRTLSRTHVIITTEASTLTSKRTHHCEAEGQGIWVAPCLIQTPSPLASSPCR